MQVSCTDTILKINQFYRGKVFNYFGDIQFFNCLTIHYWIIISYE